jgi:hypothetical protein
MGVLGPMFDSIFIRSGVVVTLVVVPIGLVVSLVFRFLGHGRTYESNYLWDKGGGL